MKRFLLNTLRSSSFQSCTLALLLIIVFYGKFLFHPGSYMFSTTPDAVKGYYTYAWQVNYAQSPFEFTGMNYPAGEHVLVADGHTAVSLLSWVFPFVKHFPVETINLLMLFGLVLTAGVVCALLREWGANHFFAVAGAVVITFLSPTIIRITGHFTLSYGFVIPLGMLWWTRLVKTGRYFSYSWKIGLLVLLFFFTHAYPGMMLAGLVFLMACCTALLNKTELKKIKFWLAVLIATIVPVLFFMVFMTLTDTHQNRPPEPTGFFENFATWKGIFLPVTGFFSQWSKTIADPAVIGFEKWAYLGTASLLLCILGILFLFMPARTISVAERKPVSFWILVIPALLMLVFAMGFPFALYPKMAEWISFVKQFRVMARFAWPFYFVAGVYAVLFIQHIWNTERVHFVLKYALVSVALVLAALDIYTHNQFLKQGMGNNPSVFSKNLLDNEINNAIKQVEKENPDFLIVLPYFHVGSEMYTRAGTDKSRHMAFTFSYHTGKPLLNVELSRTSITETERLFDMFVPHYAQKNENKNFLKGKVVVIDTREGTTYREKQLLKECTLVYSNKQLNLYVADAKKLFKQGPVRTEEIPNVLIDNDPNSDSVKTIRAFNYDDLPGGVRKAAMRDYTILDSFVAGQLTPDSVYHISFHFKTESGSRKGGMMVVQTIDKKGKVDWVEVVNLAQGGMSYRGMTIFEHGFKAREKDKRHQIFIVDGLGTNDFYLIDHYLFRQNEINVFNISDSLLNNYPELQK